MLHIIKKHYRFISIHGNVKYLFTPLVMMFQEETIADINAHGSRSLFLTKIQMNGAFFKNNSNNQYFSTIRKNDTLASLYKKSFFLNKDRFIENMMDGFEPELEMVIRLQIEANTKILIDDFQDANVCCEPDVVVLPSIKNKRDFIKQHPHAFVPVPEYKDKNPPPHIPPTSTIIFPY